MNGEPIAHLPSPSVWPATVAGGVTLLAFGVPTGLYFSALGLVIVAIGIGGWIQELRRG